MKAIQLSKRQWSTIRTLLQDEYPKTVFMLRGKMRQVLGFTVREHQEFVPKLSGGYYENQICLDFYSERKRTMFLLKFSELLGKEKV